MIDSRALGMVMMVYITAYLYRAHKNIHTAEDRSTEQYYYDREFSGIADANR